MSGSDGYQEGSRKRVKLSRTASRPVSTTPVDPILIPSDTPVKAGPSILAENGLAIANGVHVNGRAHCGGEGGDCHHEASLRTLNADLESMRQLITCKMCYRFLYEPFGLPCGHTYCYSCLATWMGNSKTCPDCRSVVKEAPTPTYLIREMVRVFTNRSELLPDGETKEEHSKHAQDEADIVAKDRVNTDVRKGGLFRGIFRRGSRGNPLMAIWDENDRVSRCPLCTVEVEDGRCMVCDVRVTTYDVSDSDEETGDELDGDLADMDDEDIDLGLDGQTDFGGYQSDGDRDLSSDIDLMHGHFVPGVDVAAYHERLRHRANRYVDSDEDEEDEDDDGNLEGFVDDEVRYEDDAEHESEDGWETDNTAMDYAAPRSQHNRRRVRVDLVSDEEDESDGDAGMQGRVVPHFQRAHQHPTLGADRGSPSRSEDEEDNSDEDNEDDDDVDDDDEPIRPGSQRARATQGRARQRRPITIESDEDEEEDDVEDDRVDFSNHVAALGNFSPASVDTEESDATEQHYGFSNQSEGGVPWDHYGLQDGASADLVSDGDGPSDFDAVEGDEEDEVDDEDDESEDGQSMTNGFYV